MPKSFSSYLLIATPGRWEVGGKEEMRSEKERQGGKGDTYHTLRKDEAFM